MNEKILTILEKMQTQLDTISETIGAATLPPREFYTVDQVAAELGKTPYTIRERYCRLGRIACEKCSASGKWKIPRAELVRLRNGGALLTAE